MRIFVFGTLKQGFPNYQHNTGAHIPGHFQMRESYPLYLVGKRQSPWLVDNPGYGNRVYGELFDVDSAALGAMDTLERVSDPDGYTRQTVQVCDETKKVQDAFVYVKSLAQFSEAIRAGQRVTGPVDEYTLEMAAGYSPRATIENRLSQES